MVRNSESISHILDKNRVVARTFLLCDGVGSIAHPLLEEVGCRAGVTIACTKWQEQNTYTQVWKNIPVIPRVLDDSTNLSYLMNTAKSVIWLDESRNLFP